MASHGHEALLAAAESGSLAHLEAAIKSGVNVNFADEVGGRGSGVVPAAARCAARDGFGSWLM